MFWVIKVIKMSFFWVFTKNSTSHAYILSKICLISKKNTLLSSPYIIMKTSILSKTLCFHVIFFSNIELKTPGLSAHFWSKNVNFVKITLHFGSIKSTKYHYSQMFFKKIKGLMPIFCQKIFYSLKTHFSYVHILSKKRPFSQKNIVLTLFFQIFAWKTSCFHTHIKSKNFNSVKTKLYYGPKKSIGCSLFLILTVKLLL